MQPLLREANREEEIATKEKKLRVSSVNNNNNKQVNNNKFAGEPTRLPSPRGRSENSTSLCRWVGRAKK